MVEQSHVERYVMGSSPISAVRRKIANRERFRNKSFQQFLIQMVNNRKSIDAANFSPFLYVSPSG